MPSSTSPPPPPRSSSFEHLYSWPAPDLATALMDNWNPNEDERGEGRQDDSDFRRRNQLHRVLSRLHQLHDSQATASAGQRQSTQSSHGQTAQEAPPFLRSLSSLDADFAMPELGNRDRFEGEGLDVILDELRRSRSRGATTLRAEEDLLGHATAAERRERAREWGRERERRRRVVMRSRQEGGASSPSATERMLRYVLERERSGMSEEEERARDGGWFRTSDDDHRLRWLLPPPLPSTSSHTGESRSEAFRRRMQWIPPARLPQINSPGGVNSTRKLEHALQYLKALQSTTDAAEAHQLAESHGVLSKRTLRDGTEDFPLNLADYEPLESSSWLNPQTVFEGHQYADASTASPDPDMPDKWPVRVTIHAVDGESMTMQGTMEAYDVPQHFTPGNRIKCGRKGRPITTYLEGHIIDLHTHSFITPVGHDSDIEFPAATAQVDAQNWIKLPPFSEVPISPSHRSLNTLRPPAALAHVEKTARTFLSRSRFEEIRKEYIFMRWKERCFVHPGEQSRGHGLTISGFYYVSLRRADGCIEGLYFDPASTPYQNLRLRGCTLGGAFEFA